MSIEDNSHVLDELLHEKSMQNVYPSRALPVKKGISREHVSYTIRPDVTEKVRQDGDKKRKSYSAIVEEILMKHYGIK